MVDPASGPLLICTRANSKNWFWFDEIEKEHSLIPSVCVLDTVDLMDCKPMIKADEGAAMCEL